MFVGLLFFFLEREKKKKKPDHFLTVPLPSFLLLTLPPSLPSPPPSQFWITHTTLWNINIHVNS